MSKLIDDKRFYRTGRDHRGGWLVSFADVHQRFEFKSMRVGKWVTKKEREHTAPLFYDALCDLLDILQAPSSLISLRQTLSLDYGTGGSYGVMAHYAPATRTFALAKNAGPGAIAHEWFHAFDHYIADKFLQDGFKEDFASHAYWEGAQINTHPLNAMLATCYDTIFYCDENANPTDYVLTSQKVDEENGQTYYSLPFELCARAFEAFVQDAPVKNNFLAKGTKKSAEAERGLYPQGEHRQKINAAYRAYFQTLGYRLQQQDIKAGQ
ncbi:CLCA_X family protein [Reinekea sp. G2M2-21]|uniref:CLCA_X family protein n=1 Tax=Reinekea sp. G2M2-21 TaxID=2788942 RepID=UPI0018A92D4D|nr:CLCA_X family protein [Reinekea sp. G2M2-21]